MYTTKQMPGGGYKYIPAVFQYSGGICALPGYTLERVQFSKPLPIDQGFEKIREYLISIGRPLQSFCSCELRSPTQFSEEKFLLFNKIYSEKLAEWGILDLEENPVARANVCPDFDKPEVPSFHAFTHTSEQPGESLSFVISGSGEVPEGKGNYMDHIVARNDMSDNGLLEKAKWVLGEMERRMNAFCASWGDTSVVQIYTVHDIHHLLAKEFAQRGILRNGFVWHLNRPPVQGLEFEMDCRRVPAERILEVK